MKNGRVEKREDGWWIVNYKDDPEMGPYDTKKEALEDLEGLKQSDPFWEEISELSGWALQQAIREHGL